MRNNRETFLEKMQTANFESFGGNDFDPENFDPENFEEEMFGGDPDNATGKRAPMRKAVSSQPLAQFTLTIVNALGVKVVVELFNYLRSIAFVNNPNISAYNPFTALDVASANANSLVYFDRTGKLIIQDAAGLKCTISCVQFPYRSLFEASSRFPLLLNNIKMNVLTDAQIDNDIIHVTNTFLGGTKRNPISPRTFFKETQFQSKIVNIPVGCLIDAEKGLETSVEIGETVTYNMYLRRYEKPQV